MDNSISTSVYYADASYACDNTSDNVYLLSYQDYNNSSYFADDSARQSRVTDWAKAKCAKYSTSATTLNSACYWTRTPRDDCWVTNISYGYFDGSLGVAYGSLGIRPGITLKIS